VGVLQVSTLNASWGKTSKERQASVGDVISELSIIREQLKHPNVVRYYKTFVLGKQPPQRCGLDLHLLAASLSAKLRLYL